MRVVLVRGISWQIGLRGASRSTRHSIWLGRRYWRSLTQFLQDDALVFPEIHSTLADVCHKCDIIHGSFRSTAIRYQGWSPPGCLCLGIPDILKKAIFDNKLGETSGN